MKKVILTASILVVCVVTLCGCTSNIIPESGSKYYDYYIIHSGYLGSNNYSAKETQTVISSKKELDEYVDKYDRKTYSDTKEFDGELKITLSKYNEDFFESKSLALYYIELSSGSIHVTPLDPIIEGDTITINYEVDVPGIGTCDMNGYVVVVEVSKDIKNIRGNEKRAQQIIKKLIIDICKQ